MPVYSPPERVDEILFDMTHHLLNYNAPEHGHTCIEIVLVLSGTAVQILNAGGLPPMRAFYSAGDGAGEQIGEATGGESGVGRVGESEAAEDSAKQFRAHSPFEAVDRAVSVLSDGLPAYVQ